MGAGPQGIPTGRGTAAAGPEGPLGVSPLGGHHQPCHRACRSQGWVTSGQTTTREGVRLHPSADNWMKALLRKALPSRARPSVSHDQSLPSGILHKPLSFLHQGPQWLKEKPYYIKLIRMKSKVMSLRKGQYKTPKKQLNEVKIGNLSEKDFRVRIGKMIQDLGKTMKTFQEMFTKDIQELKNKQTEVNNKYTGRSQ